ncbi:MAG: cccA [Hyphomicrobiales bacterium]|nr:cccA [Hyphomicrobiales bacterium]
MAIMSVSVVQPVALTFPAAVMQRFWSRGGQSDFSNAQARDSRHPRELPKNERSFPATLALLLALGAFAPSTSFAEDIDVIQGRRFAEANCSKCHQVGRFGESPLSLAPPFRTLHERYPVEDLDEALAEGIMTGHPTMPEFRLDPDQVKNLIAYLKTLERPPAQHGG